MAAILLFGLAGCGADGGTATDLGALEDGKADLGGFDVPLTLGPGGSDHFTFTAAGAFQVSIQQPQAGGPDKAIAALTVIGDTTVYHSPVQVEPSVSVTPTQTGQLSYTVLIENRDAKTLSGHLLVSGHGGGGGGGTVRFTVTGYVRGAASDRSTAISTWQAACAQWHAQEQAINGGHEESFDCGRANDVGGSSLYEFESEPALHLVATVASGGTPAPITATTVEGFSGDAEQALQSWTSACNTVLQQLKQTIGPEQFLAGVCPRPTDVGGSTLYRYHSDVQLFLAPPTTGLRPTAPYTVQGYIRGMRGDLDTARSTWQSECLDWLRKTHAFVGADLTSLACGLTDDVGGQTEYQFESQPNLAALAVLDAGQRLVTDSSRAVQGNAFGTSYEAFQDWSYACDRALDNARATHPGFLAGACAKPVDIGGSTLFQYQSDVTVYLKL